MRGKGREGPALPKLELNRDMYGFTVRPQHLQRYREYATIYKEEEEERSERWKQFLETYVDSTQDVPLDLPSEKQEKGICKVRTWSQIRPSLAAIERSLSFRKNRIISVAAQTISNHEINDPLSSKAESPIRTYSYVSEEDSDEEFFDVEKSDSVLDAFSNDSSNGDSVANSFSPVRESSTWREELECLVQGGVPMALRGELWQAFVGTKACRVEGHYNTLLASGGDCIEGSAGLSHGAENHSLSKTSISEKWTSQIEKDLPRTFPGHPALDEDGRNALRRLLTAYARHNPSVGYCQAMNFFAGLLLLLMSEENAFWTLTCIMDDYFDGYYSEEMVEAQVDQLVFEELVRGCFPKLVAHLDNLGVQVSLVTGPWFLSIFVNVLPWESVLRVWDVLLYEGNRTMLFRTALALMDLHGPALLTTKDAGDLVALLQSLAGSTFDSSQLVLTACTGYQAVDESRLQELRVKHRPKVLAAIRERSTELHIWRNNQGAKPKLSNYNLKEDATGAKEKTVELTKQYPGGDSDCLQSGSFEQKGFNGLVEDNDESSVADLQEQVKWFKIELCRALEDKRAASLRSEELETALMEMVKEDNRRLLSAKVEQLESELANLKEAIAEKQDREQSMLQVMMRIEQEQRHAEDARMLSEQDAAAQRHAANMLQEKYEEAVNSLAAMEKRAVMAESMLEATLLSQASLITSSKKPPDSPSGQEEFSKITLLRTASQRNTNQEIPLEPPARRHGLLSRTFTLGWRDRNKGKPGNLDLEALLSPTSYSSGEKARTFFSEHAKSQLVHSDTGGFSEAHSSETGEPNVTS
eukprot:Gb_37890 [translate_table: standard]